MMREVYCGVDIHSRMQVVAFCDTRDGEIHHVELNHQKDDVHGFYSQFTGKVIVGLEATGYSAWFERMIEELGHEVWIGHPTEIRRRANWRQKNDRRDAELILELMVRGEFPVVHRRSGASAEILRMLRYRHRLVKIRTMIANNLQALALSAGLRKSSMLTKKAQERLSGALMTKAMQQQCAEWISLLEPLNGRIEGVEKWLDEAAEADPEARLLRTHPGIGVLTSLALVHTLKPINRFSNQRKVVAYVGLEPKERSSAERQRFLGISKAGSRIVRFLLGEAGNVASRKDEDLKRFYSRLVFRRGKAKAKIAVARKLLIHSYIMLRDNIDYAEFRRRGLEARSARRVNRNINA